METNQLREAPTLVERFADNGEHSHWDLVDTDTSETLWSEENLQLPSKQDYEEVLKGHRELVKELDVLINGKNAAKQASLCDIVSQLKALPTQRLWQEKSVEVDGLPEKDICGISKNGEMLVGRFRIDSNRGLICEMDAQWIKPTHYLVPVEPPQNNNDKK